MDTPSQATASSSKPAKEGPTKKKTGCPHMGSKAKTGRSKPGLQQALTAPSGGNNPSLQPENSGVPEAQTCQNTPELMETKDSNSNSSADFASNEAEYPPAAPDEKSASAPESPSESAPESASPETTPETSVAVTSETLTETSSTGDQQEAMSVSDSNQCREVAIPLRELFKQTAGPLPPGVDPDDEETSYYSPLDHIPASDWVDPNPEDFDMSTPPPQQYNEGFPPYGYGYGSQGPLSSLVFPPQLSRTTPLWHPPPQYPRTAPPSGFIPRMPMSPGSPQFGTPNFQQTMIRYPYSTMPHIYSDNPFPVRLPPPTPNEFREAALRSRAHWIPAAGGFPTGPEGARWRPAPTTVSPQRGMRIVPPVLGPYPVWVRPGAPYPSIHYYLAYLLLVPGVPAPWDQY